MPSCCTGLARLFMLQQLLLCHLMDVRSSDGILNLRCSSDDYGKPNMSRISQHMEGNLRIQFDLIVGVSDWVTERSSGVLLPMDKCILSL
ncbi:hypothetical protein H5410_030782 [Solanum commersonii]|uniref:Secreted protein n=1 Tax=Solanum commersonii TaxID=4109 RepID=A0A9J5YJQ6_SOLCO|nr:hypothetical protein H5410_030782 [Solanum commersonii]